MSKKKEEEEDDDDGCFYESLDRLLSSSSAASSDEDNAVPRFPNFSSNYDIWVSEPLPIEERRKRFLNEMGLENDLLLSTSADVISGNPSTSSSIHSMVNSVLRKEYDSFVTNKPPALRKVDEFRPNSISIKPEIPKSAQSLCLFDGLREGVGEKDEEFCKIKNLDNGKEFAVNGGGEWNEVREIGSERQLTMEEFERCVGHSPIVRELMRRQNVEGLGDKKDIGNGGVGGGDGDGLKSKKKGNWFKSLMNVAGVVSGHKERRSSDEKDNSSEKGGRKSGSATDESQDGLLNYSEKVRVRQYGKSSKDLTAVYKNQEIQAHNGCIWCIKFSLDGRYLASAGEDCVILVWKVMVEKKGDLVTERSENGNLNSCFAVCASPEPSLALSSIENHLEKKRRGRTSSSRKCVNLDPVIVPDTVFALSERPICLFRGHLDDVLDLSWSKSQHLLSSSMDKTVRLWHMASKSCLKVFSHSDYVTCIQFNPVDDRYFISGSLDAKVRIWSIPNRQVVDWSDLHEMVTAASYTPDGQSALVGSNRGSCLLYNTSENKLLLQSEIDLQNKKKRSNLKKITGFQFVPGSSSEVIITSADSRIRVVHGVDLVHKFRGFRNTNSQISASLTANGKYVICASEDSHVYVWKHEGDSQPNRSKGITITQSYEHFHCRSVSVAIPWPGIGGTEEICDSYHSKPNRLCNSQENVPAVENSSSRVQESNVKEESPLQYESTNGTLSSAVSNINSSYLFDRLLVAWPEEKLPVASRTRATNVSSDISDGAKQDMSAWGMVIVTANFEGEIRIFQNFGLPVRI